MEKTKRRENVRRLVNEFVSVRQNFPDKTIAEIADEYGVTYRYVYALIPEISEKSGLSKDELLFYPHKPHVQTSVSKYNSPQVNSIKLLNQIIELLDEAEKIAMELKKELEDLKED